MRSGDKPCIAILMAVYEPRMDWLAEQLASLEVQTYPNLRLYIRDDGSPTVDFEEIEALVKEHIRSFPYEIRRNEKNLGSNGTFELLTREAEGEYFAYCDQDDIWLPEKLEVLQEAIESRHAELVCSDMFIIDGEGRQTSDSITKIRRHHRFRSGEGLAKDLLISNFVSGCTMLIRAETARAAVPFCPYMVHDHYLALYAATRGKNISLPDRLICYRIHGGNQTGLMEGVTDKASYGKVRIDAMLDRFLWLKEHHPDLPDIDEAIVWARARKSNWARLGGGSTVWKYRRFSPLPSAFEVFAGWMPEPVFRLILTAAKRDLI